MQECVVCVCVCVCVWTLRGSMCGNVLLHSQMWDTQTEHVKGLTVGELGRRENNNTWIDLWNSSVVTTVSSLVTSTETAHLLQSSLHCFEGLLSQTIKRSSNDEFLSACLLSSLSLFLFFSLSVSFVFVGDDAEWAAHRSILGLAAADLRSTDIPTSNNWYLQDGIEKNTNKETELV